MILNGDLLNLPNETIHERLLKRALELYEKDPENAAFMMADNQDDQVNFKQVYEYSVAFSEWLVEQGYQKGDVLLLAVNNHWKFMIVALGAWRAGIIVSAACSQFTPFEMRHQIEDSKCRLVFLDSSTEKVVVEAVKGTQVQKLVTFSDKPTSPNIISFKTLISSKPKNLAMPVIDLPNDLLYLPYSSGTTGKPKGVMISHLNFSMMLSSSAKRITEMTVAHGLPEDFCIPHELHFLPFYHVMGMFRAIMCFYRGSTQLIFSKFDMELMLKLIEEYSVLTISMVPAILVRLVNSPKLLEKYDISSVMNIILGSAPLPEGAVQKLRQILPDVKVAQGYGMTELTFASHMPVAGSPEESVGRLMAGTSMKVKRDDGSLCGVGEQGECWIKGPMVMKGYWGRPELLKDMFDEDGYMRTGDIVYFDKNGDTFICDRIKELIKVNAKQVAPAELESILLEHYDVADACVFGIDDPNSGEKPVACIVSKRGRDEKLAKDLIKFINEKLARYKHLKEVVFVKEIARTPTGKILRRNMKKYFVDSRKSKL